MTPQQPGHQFQGPQPPVSEPVADQPFATSPQTAAAPPPPASLSDIFAALHRAPGSDRAEETPQ
jgi:hypothetical protein